MPEAKNTQILWIEELFNEDDDHFSLDEDEAEEIQNNLLNYHQKIEKAHDFKTAEQIYSNLVSDHDIPKDVVMVFLREMILRINNDLVKSTFLKLYMTSDYLPPMAYLMNDVFRHLYNVDTSKVEYPDSLKILIHNLYPCISSITMTFIKKLFINSNLVNVIIRELRKTENELRDELLITSLETLKRIGPHKENTEILLDCYENEVSDEIKALSKECLNLIEDPD